LIKDNYKEAKDAWLNSKCEEIEKCRNKDPATMHKKIKEISGQASCSSSGCIKSENGTVIMEKEKILERWKEYIGEVFHDDRGNKPIIQKNMDGPKILKSEGQQWQKWKETRQPAQMKLSLKG